MAKSDAGRARQVAPQQQGAENAGGRQGTARLVSRDLEEEVKGAVGSVAINLEPTGRSTHLPSDRELDTTAGSAGSYSSDSRSSGLRQNIHRALRT